MPKRPDPSVMRAVFQTPAALDQLVDIMTGRTDNNILIINGKTYIVRASSTMDKTKD